MLFLLTPGRIGIQLIDDTTGDPITDKGDIGNPWNDTGSGATDELWLLLPGAAFAEVTITAIENMGRGFYDVVFDGSELTTAGTVRLDHAVAVATRHSTVDTIVEPATTPDADLGILARGTAQSATATTIRLAGSTATLDLGALKNGKVLITAGTGAGQVTTITDFDPDTQIADVADTWGTEPDVTSEYIVFAGDSPRATARDVLEGLTIEGDHPLADLMRGTFAMVAGKSIGWDAVRAAGGIGDIDFLGLNGSTVRITVTYSTDGRPTITIADLTA